MSPGRARAAHALPLLLLAPLALAGTAGCQSLRSYPERTWAARRCFEQFAFAAAADRLAPGARSGTDRICFLLERGLALHSAGRYAESSRDFLAAADLIRHYEEKALISASDAAASLAGLIINDCTQPYRGQGFEKILLHTYLALNFLLDGNLESARVEARRAYQAQQDEAERHHRRLEQAERAARERGLADDAARTLARLRAASPDDAILRRAGNVYQNAFAYYLSAVIYERNREINAAYVDCKAVHQLAPHFTPVRRDLLRHARALGLAEDYARWQAEFGAEAEPPSPQRGEGEVLLVFQNGTAPIKHEVRLVLPLGRVFATAAFPCYQTRPTPVARAALVLGGQRLALSEPLHDVEATAIRALHDELPIIVVRELIRATAKTLAANAAARQAGERHGPDAAALAGALGSLAAGATERADLRSWTLLPAALHALRVRAPAGTHHFTLELLAHGGATLGSARVAAEVREGGLTLIVARAIGTRAIAHAATIP